MYTLRQATWENFNFLFALHRAAMREYIDPIWGWHEDWQAEYFLRKFDPTNRKIIVVDGEDAGSVVLENRPGILYLSLIELMPQFQGRGIGTSIIEELKGEAFGAGLLLALHVLETNNPARRLYEKLGFRTVSHESYRYYMVCTPAEDAQH